MNVNGRRRLPAVSATVLSLLIVALVGAGSRSPTASGAEDQATLPLPTVTVGLPTITVGLPTITVGLPTVTVALPTVTLPLPTVTIPVPTATVPVPTGVLPTSTTGAPTGIPTGGATPTPDGRSTPPVAPPPGGAWVYLCGSVTTYTAASATGTGTLAIDGRPLSIRAGTALDGAARLSVGARVCLRGALDAAGLLTGGRVDGDASAGLRACGRVRAYERATVAAAGAVDIDGQPISIAAGAVVAGEELLVAGADVCVDGHLDTSGRLTGGQVSTRLVGGAEIAVCGSVAAFQAATAGVPGAVTIAGRSIVIAAGATIAGQERLEAGANACVRGRVDASGELVEGRVDLVVGSTVRVCGRVDAYEAASVSSAGWLIVGGAPFRIVAGSVLTGSDLLRLGADVCADLAVAADGSVLGGSVAANGRAVARIHACGTVAAFQSATSRSAGVVAIGGRLVPIAAGVTLLGQETVEVGAEHCLDGTVDVAGALTDGALTVAVGGTIRLCGTVRGYQAATAAAPGWLSLDDHTIVIRAATRLAGEALAREGARACLTGDVDATGALTGGTLGPAVEVGARVELCGILGAFQPATASAPGSITLDGRTLAIASGTTLDGQEALVAGSRLCLAGRLDADGRLSEGQLRLAAAARVQLCGTLAAFEAARATGAGSVTIAGRTLPIAAGTVLAGQEQARVGMHMCLDATLDAKGEIRDGALVAGGVAAEVRSCGSLTALQSASGVADGAIVIGGVRWPIAAGTRLEGEEHAVIGASYCLAGRVDASGRLTEGRIELSGSARLCGSIEAIGAGRVVLDGRAFELAPGARVDAGAEVCAAACVELDVAGRVVAVAIHAAATLEGTVTAYEPGRVVAIESTRLLVAPGARVAGDVRVGARVRITLNGARQVACLQVVVPPTPGAPGATVTPGGPTPAPPPARGRATICGVVYDAETLMPIAGASVELFGAQAPPAERRTGSNGAYCFYDLPASSTYTVVASHPRYEPDAKTVTPAPDRITWVDLYLRPRAGSPGPGPTPRPGTVVPPRTPPPAPTNRPPGGPPAPGPTTGVLCPYVWDASTGAPLPGAIIEIFADDGRVLARTVAADDGHRCVPGLAAGPVSVLARVPDCPPGLFCDSRLVRATVVAGEVRRVDVPLDCRGVHLYLPLNLR